MDAISIQKLVEWFRRSQRILPWRSDPSFYRVWVSEIMLQQTQVKTVIPYFENFVSRFPDVKTLAEASSDEVMKHWAGLGYYSRARNLHDGAKFLFREGFPDTREGWLEVKGVGEYTAGAILSIACGKAEAILDGNVERVFSRFFRVSGESKIKWKEKLWEVSRTAVARAFKGGHSPSDFNQALMELGATVCTPKNPQCLLCPVRTKCEALAYGEVDFFPQKFKRPDFKVVNEKSFVLFKREKGELRFLMKRERETGWRRDLFDFLSEETLLRFLKKKGELSHFVSSEPLVVKYVVTNHKIKRELHLKSYLVTKAFLGKVVLSEDLRWVSRGELLTKEVAYGAPVRKSLTGVIERLG